MKLFRFLLVFTLLLPSLVFGQSLPSPNFNVVTGTTGRFSTLLTAPNLTLTPQQFNAKGDGTTDDSTALINADSYAASNGYRTIYFPPGNYKAANLGVIGIAYLPTGYLSNTILVGEGKITGSNGYRRVVPLTASTISPEFASNDIIPSVHLKAAATKAVNQPLVVDIMGDSTCQAADNVSPSELLSASIFNKIQMDNPGRVITYNNRCIGGRSWPDANGTPTGIVYPDWYTNTSTPWLNYVQADAPDLIVFNFGMNPDNTGSVAGGAGGVDLPSFHGVLNKVAAFAKVPSVVFVTNMQPSWNPTINFGGYPQDQEERLKSAGFIRTYAKANGYGLFDINRQFIIARDGFDPVNQNLRLIANNVGSQKLPYTFSQPTDGDFDVKAVFSGQATTLWNNLTNINMSMGNRGDNLVVLSKDGGTGNLSVAVYEGTSYITSGFVSVVPASPASGDISFQITVKRGRITIIYNGVQVFTSAVSLFGGPFTPVINASGSSVTTPTATITASVGTAVPYMPSVTDAEIYQSGSSTLGGNTLNHVNSVGIRNIVNPVVYYSNLSLAGNSFATIATTGSASDLTGGIINNIPIGSTTPNTGKFTTLTNTTTTNLGGSTANVLANSSQVILGTPTVLGTAAGNYTFPAEIQGAVGSGNTDRLQFAQVRRVAGSNYQGTSYRIQYAVDGSFTDGSKSFIEIGTNPIDAVSGYIGFSTNGTTQLGIDASGLATFSGNIIAAGLNNTPVGNSTANTGRFTTLTTTGNASFNSLNSTPIGNTTTSTGAFTTLASSGPTALGGVTGTSVTNFAQTIIGDSDSIGTTAGSYNYQAEVQGKAGTSFERLQFAQYRNAAGSNYQGTTYRIQYAIDNSFTDGSKAFIELGTNPVDTLSGYIGFSTNGTTRLGIDASGLATFSGNINSAGSITGVSFAGDASNTTIKGPGSSTTQPLYKSVLFACGTATATKQPYCFNDGTYQVPFVVANTQKTMLGLNLTDYSNITREFSTLDTVIGGPALNVYNAYKGRASGASDTGFYVGIAGAAEAVNTAGGVFTTLTASYAAGATSIAVNDPISLNSFYITIVLNTGAYFSTTITGWSGDRKTLTISPGLPSAANAGNAFNAPIGELQAYVSGGLAKAGATGLVGVEAFEANLSLRTGSSAFFKCGFCSINNLDDTVRASSPYDMAFGASRNPNGPTVTNKYGVLFSDLAGAQALGSDSIVFGSFGPATIASVMDFTSYTVTGNYLNFQNATLTGAGALSLKSSVNIGTSTIGPTGGSILNRAYASGGAIINRINDRVFVGGATPNSGNYDNPGASDWLTNYIAGTTNIAQFASLSTIGGQAIIGASRSSDDSSSLTFNTGVTAYAIDDDLPFTISSITYSGTTATATTTATGMSKIGIGSIIYVSGASPTIYNGMRTITGVNGLTFTYTLASTPASNASGTMLGSYQHTTTGFYTETRRLPGTFAAQATNDLVVAQENDVHNIYDPQNPTKSKQGTADPYAMYTDLGVVNTIYAAGKPGIKVVPATFGVGFYANGAVTSDSHDIGTFDKGIVFAANALTGAWGPNVPNNGGIWAASTAYGIGSVIQYGTNLYIATTGGTTSTTGPTGTGSSITDGSVVWAYLVGSGPNGNYIKADLGGPALVMSTSQNIEWFAPHYQPNYPSVNTVPMAVIRSDIRTDYNTSSANGNYVPGGGTQYQGIIFTDSYNITLGSPTAGAFSLNVLSTANAANHVSINGGLTGNAANIYSEGTDANISLNLFAKASGSVVLGGTNNGTSAIFYAPTASVNYIQVNGNSSTNYPSIVATGTDTNIGLNILSKNNANITLSGSNNGTMASFYAPVGTVNYIQINGNTTGNGPSVNAVGTDANVDINIGAKGTGKVAIYSPTTIGGKATFTGTTAGVTGAILAQKVFVSTGTYTPTTGTASVMVECTGGGGAGGGVVATAASQAGAGSGGGAGAYVAKYITSGFSGVTITIGAAGGAATGANGGNGGSTTFGALLTAPGGTGGLVGTTAVPATIAGSAGGTASGGDVNISGGNGFPSVIYLATIAASGEGGSTNYGRGGTPKVTTGTASAGNVGKGYGAGGSGGASGASQAAIAGANGLAGLCIIQEYD